MALILGAVTPLPQEAAVPAWLAGVLCHAPDPSDGPVDPHKATHAHVHCALCQVAQAASLPPMATPVPLPRIVAALALVEPLPSWQGSRSHSPYASRAPPRNG